MLVWQSGFSDVSRGPFFGQLQLDLVRNGLRLTIRLNSNVNVFLQNFVIYDRSDMAVWDSGSAMPALVVPCVRQICLFGVVFSLLTSNIRHRHPAFNNNTKSTNNVESQTDDASVSTFSPRANFAFRRANAYSATHANTYHAKYANTSTSHANIATRDANDNNHRLANNNVCNFDEFEKCCRQLDSHGHDDPRKQDDPRKLCSSRCTNCR